MLDNCFLYSFFYEKDNSNLLNLYFKSTDNTKFNRNGDYYTKIIYKGLESYYIIDYGLSNDDRFKYNPIYIISKDNCKVQSEVIIFEIPYDGVKEILCHPTSHIYGTETSYSITFYNELYEKHNTNGHATNYIEIDKNHGINCYGTYFIHGKEFDTKSYNRFLKIKKIKNEII